MTDFEKNPAISFFLNTIPVGICIMKEDFTISSWNTMLESWTGIMAAKTIDKALEEVIPGFSDPLIKGRVKLVFQGGGPILLSSRFHPRIFPLEDENQNEGRIQRITITPFEQPDQKPRAMITVEDVTSITEQVLRYREIKDQIKIELEERKKTERSLAVALEKINTLGSITRHDLNNILSAIDGYIYLSLADKPGEKISAYLNKIKGSTEVMKNHIAFARDYQDMGNSVPQWFNIEDLIKKTIIGPNFSHITIKSDVGNLEILADPLIVKAVYNLIENAVRHGDHTSLITIRYHDVEDGIILIIEDNGKGIPIQYKNRIFERGFGSNSGLGLFLVREILGITGIQIIETGTEGKGARFEIRIPTGNYRR